MATKTETIEARIPGDLLKRVDAFADSELMNRSEAVRELITRGLAFGRKVLTHAETDKFLRDLVRHSFSPDARR